MVSRKGDPALMGYSRRRIPDDQIIPLFWSKVRKDGPLPTLRPDLGPCWIWTAGTNGRGYGVFSVHRERIYAHQFVCRLYYGPQPKGRKHHTRHKCDNGRIGCVRPSHIEPGTALDNARDRVERGQTKSDICRNGHWYLIVGFKLTSERARVPGKKTCLACLRDRKPFMQCEGLIVTAGHNNVIGSQCKRKIPAAQKYCYRHE